MTKDNFYKQALFAARIEHDALLERYQGLLAESQQIENRLKQLSRTIDSLIPLSGEIPSPIENIKAGEFEGLGLADACRKVLARQDRFASPVRIRNALKHGEYDLSKHSNPLAAIHSVLKRIVESGEAEMLDVGDSTGYRLKLNISDEAAEEIKKRTAAAATKIVKEEIEKDKTRGQKQAMRKAEKSGWEKMLDMSMGKTDEKT